MDSGIKLLIVGILIGLIVGIIAGYFLFHTSPGETKQDTQANQQPSGTQKPAPPTQPVAQPKPSDSRLCSNGEYSTSYFIQVFQDNSQEQLVVLDNDSRQLLARNFFDLSTLKGMDCLESLDLSSSSVSDFGWILKRSMSLE